MSERDRLAEEYVSETGCSEYEGRCTKVDAYIAGWDACDNYYSINGPEAYEAGVLAEKKKAERLVEALEFYDDLDHTLDNENKVAEKALAEHRGEK